MNLQCVEERMRGLINNLIRLSKQVCLFLFFAPAEQEFSCIMYLLTLIEYPCASGLMLRNQDTTLLLTLMFGNKLWISIRKLGKNGRKSRLRQKRSGGLMRLVSFKHCILYLYNAHMGELQLYVCVNSSSYLIWLHTAWGWQWSRWRRGEGWRPS